jgi:radical SAM protein with 4Fe4S-binding SPASM domain
MDKQHPPYTVKVELSEGCNLACTFCGINGIREKPGSLFLFMSMMTARNIARQLGALVREQHWNPHIEFTMHGEPTMNPEFVDIINVFRKALPKTQLMLTSNGGGLLKGDTVKTLNSLFLDAGLNILALDDYDGVKIVGKIRQRVQEHPLGLDPRIEWYEYPAERAGNPHTRRPVTTRMVTVIADLKHNAAEKKGVHSNIANHCGAGGPRDPTTMGRRCARPFRELAIRHNGNVAACCDDWRGEYNVGNVLKTPIEELWQNAEMQALRRKLYHGQRDFGPCLGCTSKSYRVGLLPDPQGKQSLPEPTADDLKVIAKATRKPYATIIIQRPWEKEVA